jgi:hypothetical protein
VEANPRLAEAARARFAPEVAAGRLTVLDVAIAERESVQPFWISERRSRWSSLDRASAARAGAHHAIDVPCLPLGALFARHGVPFYLKADIEGREPLCIDAIAATDAPAYVSVEAGPGAIDWLPRLHALGYTRFKCISQFAFVPMELPPGPAQRRWERLLGLARSRRLPVRVLRRLGARAWIDRELAAFRRHGEWTFPPGSSGSFGEDTPGRWLTLAEVERVHAAHHARWRRREASPYWLPSTSDDDGQTFWADFHARHATAV